MRPGRMCDRWSWEASPLPADSDKSTLVYRSSAAPERLVPSRAGSIGRRNDGFRESDGLCKARRNGGGTACAAPPLLQKPIRSHGYGFARARVKSSRGGGRAGRFAVLARRQYPAGEAAHNQEANPARGDKAGMH